MFFFSSFLVSSAAAGETKVSFADFTANLFSPKPLPVLSWAWEIFPGFNEDDNHRNTRKVFRTVTGRCHRAIKKRKDVILKLGFRIASDILLSSGLSVRTGQEFLDKPFASRHSNNGLNSWFCNICHKVLCSGHSIPCPLHLAIVSPGLLLLLVALDLFFM